MIAVALAALFTAAAITAGAVLVSSFRTHTAAALAAGRQLRSVSQGRAVRYEVRETRRVAVGGTLAVLPVRVVSWKPVRQPAALPAAA